MSKVDDIGPWSRKKLELLGKYLAAYSSIMSIQRDTRKWCKGYYYIDAFAGSVTPWDKELQQYIDGSPRVALNTTPSFSGYHFIDINEKRLTENIHPLQDQFPEKTINFHLGDCNEVLIKNIIPKFPKSSQKRAFIFLDPYGLELNWETVEAIGNAGVFDVFVNFSVMGVYRQLSDEVPNEEQRTKINKVMGTDKWISIAYREDQQLSLLEDMPQRIERIGKNLSEKLTDLYRKRLEDCFGYASKAILMRNSKGGPIYALILASHAKLAIDKMHEIFDRDERKLRKNKRNT